MVMKKIMIILCIGLLSATLNAQDAKPEIKFKSEVIDYGEIAKGSNGIRQFEFTNTGNAPLVISKVHSSCGCTIPKKPEGPIAPGETGIIEVKYDTKRVGPIRKTVSCYTNTAEGTIALKIKGTVLDGSVLEKKN